MNNLAHFHENGANLYESWYRVIIDCCLKSGASILDNRGNITKFDIQLNKNVITYCNHSVNSNKPKQKPWWDQDCNNAVISKKKGF